MVSLLHHRPEELACLSYEAERGEGYDGLIPPISCRTCYFNYAALSGPYQVDPLFNCPECLCPKGAWDRGCVRYTICQNRL